MTDFPFESRAPWTDTAIQMLSMLWPDHTSREIATVLSLAFSYRFTRNSIIGKAGRIGLCAKDAGRAGGKPPRHARGTAPRRSRVSENTRVRAERNAEIIALAKDGLSLTQIVSALSEKYPGITYFQVQGVRIRAMKSGAEIDPKKAGRPNKMERYTEPVVITLADQIKGREGRRLAFQRMAESNGCKFPIGDPQQDGFHFCCAPRAWGRPYCDHHHSLTHQTSVHEFAEAAE